MKLRVKDLDIATGGLLVAAINEEDARKLDLYHGDRISIKKGKRETTAIVDIAESRKAVPPGHAGLFEEVLDKLHAKHNDIVHIDLKEKPAGVRNIRKKLLGKALTRKELNEIVNEIVNDDLSNIELTYFISACFTNGMTLDETVSLAKAIVKYGGQVRLKKKPILDKHCSGGVPGNRTTMIIVPVITAAGFYMPKTSSRSITSPAGTADTMEVLAPVSLEIKMIEKVVNKTKGCICWGGAVNLAAADDKLIKIRHPLSLDPEGMLLASILAKKAAVGATHVLIDIPVGKDAKIKTKKQARHLERRFNEVGEELGMKIHVMVSDGTEPIGHGIGPALEARDVLWLLRRDKKRPLDLELKAVKMATRLLRTAGVKNPRRKVLNILNSGMAYEKMKEIIKAQGGDPNINPDKIKIGKYTYTFKAKKSGKIVDIDNITIAKVARVAGAPKDKEAGIYLYKHENAKVKKGEPIFTIHAKSPKKLKFALEMLGRVGGIYIK
jgi:AMP phosphorylase